MQNYHFWGKIGSFITPNLHIHFFQIQKYLVLAVRGGIKRMVKKLSFWSKMVKQTHVLVKNGPKNLSTL